MQEQQAIVAAPKPMLGVWTSEQVDLIKRTIAVGATDDELRLFGYVCQRTGLDPFVRQIYAIKRQGKMVFQTGIDGYRMIADATGTYAGSDDTIYLSQPDGKFPISATVTVYKFVQGQRCPFSATARWDEYFPSEAKDQWMWKRMPYGQLGKCAEALALRKAFPMNLSGLLVHEEMEQAGAPSVIVPSDQQPAGVALGLTTTREEQRQRPVPSLSRAPEKPPETPEDARRTALLNEITALYREKILPLQHAGMYRAICMSCFALDKPSLLKDQSLDTYERGMKLYRRITAVVGTWDRNATPLPDNWIREQVRKFAAEDAVATDAFRAAEPLHDEETGELIDDEEQRRREEEAELLARTTA